MQLTSVTITASVNELLYHLGELLMLEKHRQHELSQRLRALKMRRVTTFLASVFDMVPQWLPLVHQGRLGCGTSLSFQR